MLGVNKFGRAIIVVDMIDQGACETAQDYIPAAHEIIPFVQGELQYFRERMRSVIFCSSAESSQIIRELSPRTGEICIKKSRPNAFFNTDLDRVLRGLKITNITIVGMPLPTSILLTSAAALDHGYSVVVPETCVCSANEEDHVAALRLINRWSNDMSMKPDNS